MSTVCSRLAVAALSCCIGLASAQQRPAAAAGQRSDAQIPYVIDQLPRHGPGSQPGGVTGTVDDVIRKQTAAIVELSERLDRMEKRVAELEAKVGK